MTRNLVVPLAVFSLLILSSAESAGPHERRSPCAACLTRTPILESGRPPLPGEDGVGVQFCRLINTKAEWDAYCSNNVVPDCPLLDEAFFAQHTVVAVAIDTLTSLACEGSPDPVWALDCVTSPAIVRVVKERPGGGCLCSAMPQHLQRLFLASAVPKTRARTCRVCEESHTIDCLR